jgi:hypothetical protein
VRRRDLVVDQRVGVLDVRHPVVALRAEVPPRTDRAALPA